MKILNLFMGGGSFIFTALLNILKNMFLAVASEKFLEWLLFTVLKGITKSTKTDIDDAGLKYLEDAYLTVKEKKHVDNPT